MKTLLLMRHAKSSEVKVGDAKAGGEKKKADEKKGAEKSPRMTDQDRPLSKRGDKDAAKMADLLLEKNLMPQYILTSAAARSRRTAAFVVSRGVGEVTLRGRQSLYMAEAPEIMEEICQVEGNPDILMVIGHNPGLEALLQYMTGKVESLPTATVACLEMPIAHWSELNLQTLADKYEVWKPKKA